EGVVPFRYVGLPVGVKPRSLSTWEPLLEQLRRRLNVWENRYREFLWGGGRGARKINWIKWKVVCQPKSNRGLGVRDVRAVNLSIFAKWRWRLLQSEHSLWEEVLVGKYGNDILSETHCGNFNPPLSSSRWWKDLCQLKERVGSNWFSSQVFRWVNIGVSSRFWSDHWLGGIPLCQ
ncbi:RNA-directed DNA polymerase (Reverse transcriptase), partial [Trifolium medium]|nr:RNA-directed DNA polymerase (Reverse transcriptase) [Trifolium medium]